MHHAPQVTPLDAPDAARGTVIEHEAPQARPQTGGHADCGAVLHVGDGGPARQEELHSGNADELRVLLNERHDQWLREQYLRDLATLDRIEHQNACFFDAMGAIAAKRGGNGA